MYGLIFEFHDVISCTLSSTYLDFISLPLFLLCCIHYHLNILFQLVVNYKEQYLMQGQFESLVMFMHLNVYYEYLTLSYLSSKFIFPAK